MKKNCSVVFILFCFLYIRGYAQVSPADSLNMLQEFTAVADRFKTFNTGVKTSAIDSLTRQFTAQNSLANLLAISSPVFIKTYGPGQLATTSFRGAGAEHTAVLWNGINIQSNMHGQLDFSLIPAGFMDETEIDFGGNSALYGAGAVGGAVLLNNTPAYRKHVSANYRVAIGSFGLLQHWGGAEYGNERFYIKARTYRSGSENNFGYYDYTLPDKPLKFRKNAGQYGTGTLLETGYRISKKQELNFRYWYSYNNRNLPPTIGVSINESYQLDESNRMSLEWKNTTSARNRWVARVAYLNERLDYHDPLTYLSGKSRSNTLIGEAENFYDLHPKLRLNTGINYSLYQAESENYIKSPTQHRIAGFASLKARLHARLTASVSVRQELIAGQAQPFTAAAGLNFKAGRFITLTAHANKSYRVPTFNDLYWITGNPGLKAESGFGQELGTAFRWSNSRNHITASLNGFNRNITNWILWQPNGGTWTPQNLKSVWSRGGEFSGRYTRMIHKVNVTLKSDISYVLSTNQTSIYSQDESVGKQLIFIPRLTHQNWITVSFRRWYLAYNHTYTGYRFTSSDNRTFLDDYQLGNVFSGYSFPYRKITLDVHFQYNNIWNTRYEVLPAKPMPMSNYQLTCTLKFNS